jgi:choline dehydrogenase
LQCDYIIVGGGTAGCILAERLSASGKDHVLLIEAGGRPTSPFVKIPAGFSKLFKSKCDWNYTTVAQAHADGRQIYVPRGKLLGGSANMNASIHQWGHPADFDGWSAMGASGWSWDDVLPLFRALESEVAFEINGNCHTAATDFVAAARQICGHAGPRYNGIAFDGAWIAEISTRRGKRYSVYDTHLRPALNRKNLSVITAAKVDQIRLNDGRATGVKLVNKQIIDANAGVILTAGAIESPAILMRSGIGDGDTLRALGIRPQIQSPHVGRHVQDHPMVVPNFATVHRDSYKSAESLPNLVNYLLRRRGPLASNVAEAIAFARSTPEQSCPDIECLFAPLEWRNEALEPPAIHAYSIGVAVVAPRSRGTIGLTSPNPHTPPSVDFGLFSDAEGVDRQAMLSGIRLARRLATTEPLASHLTGEHSPGKEMQSDEALFDWICRTVQTVYHPSGSCRMGKAGNSVVSPQLSLHGLDRLWIADASIMPSLVRGHPNMSVAMIAARAAKFITAAQGRYA